MRELGSALSRRRFLLSLLGTAIAVLAGCVRRPAGETPSPLPAATRTPIPAPSATEDRPAAPAPTGAAATQATPTAVEPTSTPGITVTASPTPEPTVTLTPTPVRPIVAVTRCADYGAARVEAAVRELVAQCGGLQGIVRPGATVVIKPNFTTGGRAPTNDGLPNILSYTTHPDVTRAIALLAKEAGAGRIILTEGWGSDVWALNGYDGFIRELGLETVNLDDPAPAADFTAVPVPGALELQQVLLHEAIAQADVFISVPKMKCHASCGVTLSIKNVLGCTPLPRYREHAGQQARSTLHTGHWGVRLPRIVIDILRARPVDFAVVDAISTLDQGEGPWLDGVEGAQVRTVRPQLLLAGRNPVAVDVVGTALMGFDPAAAEGAPPFTSSANHIALAAGLGLGPGSVDEIYVRGVAVEEAAFPFTPCPRVLSDAGHSSHLAMERALRRPHTS